MKKIWKAVMIVVSIAFILGAVCFGVGIFTGADTGRIFSVLDNRYNLTALYDVYSQYAKELIAAFQAAGF